LHDGSGNRVRGLCYPALSVSLNLLVAQLLDPDLVPHVAEAAANCGLSPDHLHLEVTESVLSTDREAAARVLEELPSLGVKLAIDDFGTGNSSSVGGAN